MGRRLSTVAEQNMEREGITDAEQLVTDFSEGIATSPKGLRMPSLQSHPTLARTPSHLLPEDLRVEDGVLITEVQHEDERMGHDESEADFVDDPTEYEEHRPEGAEYDTDLDNEGNSVLFSSQSATSNKRTSRAALKKEKTEKQEKRLTIHNVSCKSSFQTS